MGKTCSTRLTALSHYWATGKCLRSERPTCKHLCVAILLMPTFLTCRIMNAGCCKILLHPQWGSVRTTFTTACNPCLSRRCYSQAVYPASIFTTAPAECVLAVLAALPRARSTEQDDVSTYVTGDDEIQVTHCQSLSS